MAYTQLSPIALPGRTYSFAPKEGATGVKPSDQVTALSVVALPGPLHEFLPKAPGVSAKGEGLFTWLSPIAVPGMRHSFTAKEAAIVEAVTTYGGRKFFKQQVELQRQHILREDKELMEFLSMIVKAGLLN